MKLSSLALNLMQHLITTLLYHLDFPKQGLLSHDFCVQKVLNREEISGNTQNFEKSRKSKDYLALNAFIWYKSHFEHYYKFFHEFFIAKKKQRGYSMTYFELKCG